MKSIARHHRLRARNLDKNDRNFTVAQDRCFGYARLRLGEER
mgnify:CR=1 FL=1